MKNITLTKPSDKKMYLFEQAPIWQAVCTLCVPTVVSALVFVIYGLADTYFVGMLNDPVQNAAVTLANPALMLFNVVTNLFGVGGASLMSRALGSKDYTKAMQTSTVAIYCSAFMGLLYSLSFVVLQQPILQLLGADATTQVPTLAYLKWTCMLGAVPSILNVVLADMIRAEGGAIRASIGIVGGSVLNIVLDPFFVLPWGLDMGVAGAGAATCLSNFVVCLYFLCTVLRQQGTTFICIAPSGFRPRAVLGAICAVGIPAATATLLTTAGMTILNHYTATYGAVAVAAMGIALRIDLIPCNVCSGISNGLMPMISYNYASGNITRMKRGFFFTLKSTVVAISLVAVFYFFFAEIPVSLFIDDPEVVSLGAVYLKSLCLSLPFYAIDFVNIAVFNACGYGRYVFLFAFFRNLFLQIPALYILDAMFPMYGVPYAFLASESMLALAGCIVIGCLFSRLGKQAQEQAMVKVNEEGENSHGF